MNVSDLGKMMRATIRAAQQLVEFRNLHPVALTHECRLEPWLKMSDYIEELPHEMFEQTARAFGALMLNHQRKNDPVKSLAEQNREALDAERAAQEVEGEKKRKRWSKRLKKEPKADGPVLQRAIEQAESGSRQVVRVANEVMLFDDLCTGHARFLPHMHQPAFVCPPGVRRSHATLRERLALLVHAGGSTAAVRASLERTLDRLMVLRRARAAALGYGAQPRQLPCLIMVVLWPTSAKGGLYTRLEKQALEHEAFGDDNRAALRIELVSVDTLQFDVTRNASLPRFSVVHEPHECDDLRTIKPYELRYMRESDPQARVRALRPGQVVRVDRQDLELGGDVRSYLMVVSDSGYIPRPWRYLTPAEFAAGVDQT